MNEIEMYVSQTLDKQLHLDSLTIMERNYLYYLMLEAVKSHPTSIIEACVNYDGKLILSYPVFKENNELDYHEIAYMQEYDKKFKVKLICKTETSTKESGKTAFQYYIMTEEEFNTLSQENSILGQIQYEEEYEC